MKNFIKILILTYGLSSFCQNDFDKSLKIIAEDIANQIEHKGKTNIAVWHFSDINKNNTSICKYVASDLSINLTIADKSFQVMNRRHLNQILNEHELNSDALFDKSSAVQLGKMLGVNYIVTGDVDVYGRNVKIRILVIDTETGHQIAAKQEIIPADDNIANLLGLKIIQKESDKILEPSSQNIPVLEPTNIYKTNTGGVRDSNSKYYSNRQSNLSPRLQELERSIDRKNRTVNERQTNRYYSNKQNVNKNQGLILVGAELLKFLTKKRASSLQNEKNVIRKYNVSKFYSNSNIQVNTAYYSKISNSVHSYIKTKNELIAQKIRVSIRDKKGIEIANCMARISLKKGEANYYEFKFPHTFEYSNKASIYFE